MQDKTCKSLLAALVVVVAVVAVIGVVYLLAPEQEPGGGNAKAGPTIMTPTVPPQTRAIPITSVRRGDDPRTLVIEYAVGVGDCFQTLDKTEVNETPATVTIRLVPQPSSKPMPEKCFDQVLLLTTAVRLADPLGKRKVVDATTGATFIVQ